MAVRGNSKKLRTERGARCGDALHGGTTELKTNRETNDRRAADRFPIERDLKFRVLTRRNGEEGGAGKTINMSSNGVLFSTDQVLLPGRRVEIAISWPAQLNSKVALKLVARGRVVRFEPGIAAIEIQQYEFRTQASQPFLVQ